MNIYKITNRITNKIYVGKTNKDIHIRFKEHKKNAANRTNRYLYDAMNHYGKDAFTIELIEVVDSDIANERERYWISLLNSKKPLGYNMTDGGDGGYTLSEWSEDERKQLYKKQGNSRRGKRSLEFSKKMKAVAKVREANKTPEQKRAISNKISDTLKRKGIAPPAHVTYGEDNPNYVNVDIELCIELIRKGCSQKEIALHFGTTSATIWSKLKKRTGKTYNELRRIDR